MACGGRLGRWPPQGLPVLPERVYRQNIEQLEKVRGEWEQEHRTTCEVRHSRRGGCFPSYEMGGTPVPAPATSRGGGRGGSAAGKASFLHSFTHPLTPQALCWVPAPGELTAWLCALGPLLQAGILHPFWLKPKLRLRQNP